MSIDVYDAPLSRLSNVPEFPLTNASPKSTQTHQSSMDCYQRRGTFAANGYFLWQGEFAG
jgi:hypothetical protein